MSGGVGRGPPKFPHASPHLKKAVKTLRAEYLAHALRNHSSPERAYVPTPAHDAASQTLFEETQRRTDKLYEHYGLDANDPQAAYKLVQRLACDLIPNFDPFYISARGRPQSTLREHRTLVVEIEALRREDNRRSLIAACRILAKTPGPWKGKRPTDLQAAYYRFYEAQGPITDLLQRERARSAEAVATPEGEACGTTKNRPGISVAPFI